jgi:hypothetical protein|nr:MAG TPA: hypothetical protein [Caudoviricetes sp.]
MTEEDFGCADPIKGDYVDDWRPVEVCDDCGAKRIIIKGKPYTDEDGCITSDDDCGDWQKN